MRAQRIQLRDRCGFDRTARALPLDAEKQLVAGRQSDRHRCRPAEPRRPQEIAINGINRQLIVGEDVIFAHEAAVAGGDRPARS